MEDGLACLERHSFYSLDELKQLEIIISRGRLIQNLDRLEMAYDNSFHVLSEAGIINKGQLLLSDGTKRDFRPWSEIADIIINSIELQKKIVHLEKGDDGLPAVMPNLDGGDLVHQITRGEEAGLITKLSFNLESAVTSGNLVAFDPRLVELFDAIQRSGSRGKEEKLNEFNKLAATLTVSARIAKGEFGTGRLGAIFADNGPEFPEVTAGMKLLEFHAHCEKHGFYSMGIQNRQGMELVASKKDRRFDSGKYGWVNSYFKQTSRSVHCGWDYNNNNFYLTSVDQQACGPSIGGRRMVVV